jgi:hypothetical protein
MKKYILAVFSAIFLFNLAQAKDFSASITFDKDNIKQIYQEDLKNLSEYISQEVAAQTSLYANERVKNMCKEWPTCEEWAKNKLAKDTTFQVIDTEVERWVKKWEGKTAIWGYNFYVQAKENGQTKAYLFKRGDKGTSYAAPVLIKKFPGHPIHGKPSEHILHIAQVDNHANSKSWPGVKECNFSIRREITSQYIYKYDEQGNALWKRRLYLHVNEGLLNWNGKVYYFQAYQTKAGGDYTYEGPVKTGYYPAPAN